MKKAVAFLLAFLIFVAPMTTFVKADVVIGDNDDTIINENATILGRKLALMESLSDLALSGVTEFTISNTNDVDSYLDYLWNEIDNAIDSLSDGTGFTEISNQLKSKYFTNLVQYKDYINNRGNYLANLLPSGNPTTSLLSTFFANNIYGKQYTEHYDLALDMFRSLSALTSEDNPPDIPSELQVYIDIINRRSNDSARNFWFFDNLNPTGGLANSGFRIYDYSWYTTNNAFSLTSYTNTALGLCNGIQSVYINSDNLGGYNCDFHWSSYTYNYYVNGNQRSFNYGQIVDNGDLIAYTQSTYINFTHSGSLNQIFNALKDKVKNVNIYVDNVLWSSVGDVTNSQPTLDIDGFLKIFGNNNPQQYELQPQTKIDYDQLYQVIYNAIRDNLPISQGDINYYDSHDTIYSPTIINNYGEEEGDESDLIDTILDYAVIPKFDTAIAQPMRQALTNGVVIMNTSITNVIPNEILLILGACFFLLLFAVVINRMIK